MHTMKVKEGATRYSFLAMVMFLALLPNIGHLTVPVLAKPPPFVPSDSLNLNCLASAATVFSNGQKLSLQSSSKSHYSHEVSKASIQSSADPISSELSACIFRKQVSYPFPVSTSGMHFIRLYFYPTSYQGLNMSKALFSVNVAQYTLLSTSESSLSSYPSDPEYIIKEFCINVDHPVLNITFTPSRNSPGAYGFVNKIEIVSMPLNLYVSGGVQLPFIGNHSKFFIGNSTALEMMYRLNVGGDSISAEDDTGMLRVWSQDEPYLVYNATDHTTTLHPKVSIKYSRSVPAHTAPLKIYATVRAMGPSEYYNLTWHFPLDGGFNYLVRLHFCEIMEDIGEDGQRVFQVYLNGQTAENHADVIHWSGGVGVPVYRDYVVNSTGNGQEMQLLSLELQSKTGLKTLYNLYHGAILNGLEIFKLSDHANNLAGPFPFRSQMSNRLSENRSKIVLIPCALLLSLAALLYLCFIITLHFPIRWCPLPLVSVLRGHSKGQRTSFKQWPLSDQCRYFTLPETKAATNNFSDANLIGAGGFGKVYKGYIDGSATPVAIKRGSATSHQGLHEFQTEITMLSKLRHRHLVSLIGYCMDGKEMILVYDFMAKGTLRDHLYNTKKPPLPWKQRLEICIGAARGLHYLHADARQSIIHRDVKTTNILLDKRWVAKVADFGLSKFGPNIMSCTHVSTAVKGSFGYLDPEYYRRQKLTEKSDVYSFGVVLMEVLCARPAVLPMVVEEEFEKANLAEWALLCHQLGTLHQIIDPFLKGKIEPECFKTFTETAKKCLADRGSERPTMVDVLWNLELARQQQQQQEAVSAVEETSTRTAGVVSVKIDGQSAIGIGNSDPTPGAEFSELMAPRGR